MMISIADIFAKNDPFQGSMPYPLSMHGLLNTAELSAVSRNYKKVPRIHTMSIDKYRTDAVVARSYKTSRSVKPPESNRVGGVPSSQSLKNLIFILNNCDQPMTSMVTLTFQRDVSKALTVAQHKVLIHAALTKLRRAGGGYYVWVREFTEKQIPHWHIFTTLECTDGVDESQSKSWSQWFGESCSKALGEQSIGSECERMMHGNGCDFLGCVRVERLRSDAAGRYAGKEGGKRFQKVAPPKWMQSGLWWKAAKAVKCTPGVRIQVRTSSLKAKDVVLPDGTKISVPYKYQYSRGLAVELEAEYQQREPYSEFMHMSAGSVCED